MESKDAPTAVSTHAPRVAIEDLPSLLLDNLTTGLLAVGDADEILFMNRVAEEILDLDLDDVRGRPLSEVIRCDDDEWLKPASSDDRLGDPRRHRETSLSVGEKEVVIEYEARTFADRRGRPLGVVLTFFDVSDIAEDEEFRRTAERLAHLGELSAVVAHEIRNPLTGIRTTIQFLCSKLASDDSVHMGLQDVLSELDRIEKIITDLLVLARPSGGMRTSVDINAVIEKCLDSVKSRIETSGITLRREMAPDLPRVEVDDAVQQVFVNMIVNAIDAMEGVEDPVLKVSTALRRYRVKRPTVEVSFSDTGCGIPPDLKERIFDPFFTTKPMGTGLGLPLSLQIMKDHGGTIHVRNRPQGGTIFKLQYPVPEESEVER
jgi:PAS domain S-box-containing protein